MPNTLGHIGGQGAISSLLFRHVDPKWIYIGCLIPDFPWILLRITRVILPDLDIYTLRLYFMVMASLFSCLIFCAAIAILTTKFWKVFLILGINAFVHLILDALQLKWGNGVHLLAPFSWKYTRFELFWPESIPSILLTVLGIIYIASNWKKGIHLSIPVKASSRKNMAIFIFILLGYFILPYTLMTRLLQANNFYIKTLMDFDEREGKFIEFNRMNFVPDSDGGTLTSFAGETFKATGIKLDRKETVAVRARFISPQKLDVIEFHILEKDLRDLASYAGILVILVVWIIYIINHKKSTFEPTMSGG
jgi:hypothetical protein